MTNNINKAEITNIKEEYGYSVEYSKNNIGIGYNRVDSYDTFDRIINKGGKFFLYDEMSKNEPLVVAHGNLIESYANPEEFYTVPAEDNGETPNFDLEEAKRYKKIIDQILDDMEIPFSECFRDWLTFIKYGFSVSEVCLKKRLGSNPNNPKKHSKYNDGLIGVRKFASRHQKTIEDWQYDKYGRISTVVQSDPNKGMEKTSIPYNRVLHFKVKSYNGNPYGQSLYRGCAVAYYNKKNIMREQMIRDERGFVGIPEISYPMAWANPAHPMHSMLSEFEATVKNLKIGQDVGIVRPRILDKDSGKELLTFEIKSGTASGREDTDKMIDRQDSYIAISLLSDMFITGKTASITGALGQLKISIFISFVSMLLNIIKEELNNKLLPLIWEANGFPNEYMPKFAHSNLSKLNMTNIMLFLQSLGKTKLLTSTFETENALRDLVFNGAIPHVTEEEFKLQQKFNEVNSVDNLDIPTVDNWDTLHVEDSKK